MQMPDNTLISRIKKLTPEQLDAELASHEHNDIGRHIILQEMTRRSVAEAARPNWVARVGLFIAVVAAILAGISALPEIRSWLREASSDQPSPAPANRTALFVSTPDYGLRPTEACRQAIQAHYHRVFGPNLAFQFDEATEAAIDDPEKPGLKISGWLFEARWNFKAPAKSNFPMAARFLARADSVILTASIGGPFEMWEAVVARNEGKKQ